MLRKMWGVMTGDPQAIRTLILSEQPHSHLSNTLRASVPTNTRHPGGIGGKELLTMQRRMDVVPVPWWGGLLEVAATLVFLHGESHEQRSIAGFSPWG